MERFKIIEKSQINSLPKTAGVYSFYAKKFAKAGLSRIYIGKAVNIRDRVKNHFSQPSYRDNLFISQVNKVGYFETDSEIEALILEANLIKKHQPKYNVVWRDDKSYFYAAIAKNEQKIPYVYITHQPHTSSLRGASKASNEAIPNLSSNSAGEIASSKGIVLYPPPRNDSATFIGPFVEGAALKKTLRFLRRVFPYYTNKKHSKNKCTYCHLGLCPGPRLFEARLASPFGEAANLISEYRKNINKLILILKGKRNAVLNSLRREMKQMSKENKYEEAAKLRDRIFALQQVMSHTRVIENSKHEIPRPYGQGRNQKPLAVAERARQFQISNFKFQIPERAECYDISNIQGKMATGSMVVFINGQPDKNQYRKFSIRTAQSFSSQNITQKRPYELIQGTPNDIAMLKQVLQRRFQHPEWPYPDIILVDGGKAQLNIAIKTKKESLHQAMRPHYQMQVIKNIKIMAIAKGRQDPLRPRSEARLFIEGQNPPTGGPIPLKDLPQEIYNLIKHLDDEAHRFAISYHKKLRKKNLLE